MKNTNVNLPQKRSVWAKILGTCIKYYQTIWFLAMVALFSVFVFCGFTPQINFNMINAENIIFCAWIVLLFVPLIKSIDIAGILKLVTKEEKEKEKETENLKIEKDSLVNTVNLNISNTNTQQSSKAIVVSESSSYPYTNEEGE